MSRRLVLAIGLATIIIAVGACLMLFDKGTDGGAPEPAPTANRKTDANQQDAGQDAAESDAQSQGQRTNDGTQADQSAQSPAGSDDVLSDEEFATALDAVEEAEPSDAPPSEDPSVDGVLAQLQGWWRPADGSQGVVCVFEGRHYSEMSGNGRDTQRELEVADAHMTHAEGGWTLSLGESSLFVPDDNPEQPVLTTSEGSVTLMRGEGNLY